MYMFMLSGYRNAMNVHVHVEWLQECYEYATSYRTWDPLFRAFFYLSCTAGCVHGSPSLPVVS